VRIPWQELSSHTLETLLEEIVTRDGTDYGSTEKSTIEKITFARNQLKNGDAVLYWNTELESASLLSLQQAELIEADDRID